MSLTEAVMAAADRLEQAFLTAEPAAPVRDILGSTDVASAYAVQSDLMRRRMARGAVVTGRKIGLTSAAVQRQLGVDQPDFGILFGDMERGDGSAVALDGLLQPKVEAEIAFVLGEDLIGDLDLARVRSAVTHAVAALEIVDSRIADWDITIVDTIADNGSSALYVVGATHLSLEELEPREVTMTMTVDGKTVSAGTGAACLGDPLEALLWLARSARDHGDPLRAGQVVLSGALGPMAPVTAGTVVRADIGRLGSVSVRFTQGEGA